MLAFETFIRLLASRVGQILNLHKPQFTCTRCFCFTPRDLLAGGIPLPASRFGPHYALVYFVIRNFPLFGLFPAPASPSEVGLWVEREIGKAFCFLVADERFGVQGAHFAKKFAEK